MMARTPAPPASVPPRRNLTPREFGQLQHLVARLPPTWIATRRRRRLLFLALAAPGFFAFFSTIYHRSFFVMIAGLLLFSGALAFRLVSEPLFARAEASELLPAPFPPTRMEDPGA